jgi:hypothetical protein
MVRRPVAKRRLQRQVCAAEQQPDLMSDQHVPWRQGERIALMAIDLLEQPLQFGQVLAVRCLIGP